MARTRFTGLLFMLLALSLIPGCKDDTKQKRLNEAMMERDRALEQARQECDREYMLIFSEELSSSIHTDPRYERQKREAERWQREWEDAHWYPNGRPSAAAIAEAKRKKALEKRQEEVRKRYNENISKILNRYQGQVRRIEAD